MNLFLFKLFLTPLLLLGTTLATRRWGPAVGGWLVSLPLTSGPVSLFLALDHGPEFAAVSAHGTLDGLIAIIFFCLAYEKCLSRFKWPATCLIALASYAITALALNRAELSFITSTLLVALLLPLATLAIKPVTVPIRHLPAPRWDLPFRMIAATALVLGITTASHSLGPELSGMLAAFPVFICVMSAFSHGLYGEEATRKFERSVVVGSYAFAIFFLIVALTITRWPMPLAYSAATAGGLGANALVYAMQRAMHHSWYRAA
jgi:hypothetical protein